MSKLPFRHFLKTHTKKRNKYGAIRGRYKGRSYHSQKEAEYAMWLDSLKREGKVKKIEPQKRYDLVVNGLLITTHIPDFLVTLADGRKKIVEVKGFGSPVWPIKRKLFEALYPELPYLVNPSEKQLLI